MKAFTKRSILKAAILVGAVLSAPLVFAQSQDGVRIYDFCNFGGDSAYVSEGEHRSLKNLRFKNDRISSIRVPDGYEVRIYEDDDFRGDFATITSDIRCFDEYWNDRVSSINVVYKGTRQYQQNQPYNNQQAPVRNKPYADNVNLNNLGSVTFGRSVLQKTSEKQWRLVGPRKGQSQFREVRREGDMLVLKNEYTSARLRVDLFSNDITVVQANGQVDRYPITSARAKTKAFKKQASNNKSTPKVLRLAQRCVNYRAYTTGGIGGMRVYGSLEFRQFGKKPISGKICVDDASTLELQKNNNNTDVYLEIAGQSYRFAPGEAHDVYKNTWYRRKTQLLYRPKY